MPASRCASEIAAQAMRMLVSAFWFVTLPYRQAAPISSIIRVKSSQSAGNSSVPASFAKGSIPKENVAKGAPRSLRATQLFALNASMECNVITMKDADQSMLDMLRVMKERSREHLGVDLS